MRQMSLRAFRDSIATLHQPVEVSKRDGDGNIQVLGFWTPYMQHPPDAKPVPILEDQPPVSGGVAAIRGGQYVAEERTPLDIPIDDEPEFPMAEETEFDRHPLTAPRVISSPEQVAAAVRVDPLRAVPKPSQRKGKR